MVEAFGNALGAGVLRRWAQAKEGEAGSRCCIWGISGVEGRGNSPGGFFDYEDLRGGSRGRLRRLARLLCIPWSFQVRHGQAEVDFGNQADERKKPSALGFEVAQEKALDEHEGDEEDEQEVDDGVGMVLEAMVEGPVGGQLVEGAVFDIPASVAGGPESARRQTVLWDGGRPPPGVMLGFFFPSSPDSFPLDRRFFRVEHADGLLHSFHCVEAFLVPGVDGRVSLPPREGREACKQSARILEKRSGFVLDHRDDVFAVLYAEIEERRFEIQAVSDHGVEKAGIFYENPFQQPFRGHDLALAGALRLQIKRQVKVMADQMADHAGVVKLEVVALLCLDRPLAAGLAMAVS